MAEENITQEFRLMSKKHKKVCTTLNYIVHFFVLASTITECISISASAFASLVDIPTGTTISAIGLTICETFARIKRCR